MMVKRLNSDLMAATSLFGTFLLSGDLFSPLTSSLSRSFCVVDESRSSALYWSQLVDDLPQTSAKAP